MFDNPMSRATSQGATKSVQEAAETGFVNSFKNGYNTVGDAVSELGFGMAGKVRFVTASPGMVTQVVVWQAIKGGKLFMVYKWKDAARIKSDAQTAGEICEKLEKNGGLTAKRLVDESRPEDAPLHKEFEWDDATAAEAYREEQARYIIRSLIVQPEESKREVVRAFFPMAEQKVFESLPVILSDAKKTSALLDMALRELKAFELKYSTLSQLAPVFGAIKEVRKE